MFHMGWFMGTGFGVYQWNQRWSGNVNSDVGQPSLFIDMAKGLERAGFDYMMMEDSSVLPNIYKGTFEASVHDGGTVRFDPVPLVPLLAANTKHLGIVATIATTFYPPFLAARLFTTLDHLTGGRVGLNVVTASPHQAAQNYGFEQHLEHDERYQMADEWVDVVKGLWETWEPDAVLMDERKGIFADHTKIHTLDHDGRFFKSRGPLNTPPGPQRHPVICQAGGSNAGREFGARNADTIIAAVKGPEEMKAYRDDISARAIKHGRRPEDVKVLFLVHPILADSREEAVAKREASFKAQAENVEGALAGLSYFTSTDFSKFDLDAPFPDIANNGHQSTVADYARSGKTLREAISNHRVQESAPLVGTPDDIAAQMEEYMDTAGGDGYLIAMPVTRKNITEICDGLAPALRKRDLIRSEYTEATFRENLLAY
jgi:FMN-dependent oxidoreductase (nitrilotriacetate monooxygenase family)